MKSICDPFTPPAALISLTASLAPFAAGRSRADSSPVRAKPPPIVIVPPPAAPEPAGAAEHAPRTSATAATKGNRFPQPVGFMASPPKRKPVHATIGPRERNAVIEPMKARGADRSRRGTGAHWVVPT